MNKEEFESGQIKTEDEAADKLRNEALERGAMLSNNLTPPQQSQLPAKKFNIKITSEKLNINARDIYAQVVSSLVDQTLSQTLYRSDYELDQSLIIRISKSEPEDSEDEDSNGNE